jgi:mitochondrial import receptor subunit TOM40
MGSAASAAAPPPPPPADPHGAAPQYGHGLAGILPPKPEGDEKKEEKVDYLNLPCPVAYEEIQREALSSYPSPSTH